MGIRENFGSGIVCLAVVLVGFSGAGEETRTVEGDSTLLFFVFLVEDKVGAFARWVPIVGSTAQDRDSMVLVSGLVLVEGAVVLPAFACRRYLTDC